jgi:hypothetical protein
MHDLAHRGMVPQGAVDQVGVGLVILDEEDA